MIATRLALLVAATVLALAALGATTTDVQPSARLVMITAVTGLIAPLFWPGRGATPVRTALRVGAWSGAAALLAALAALAAGSRGQPLARTVTACAVLLVILLATHAVTAGLEGLLRARTGDADGARELAGRTATLALAAAGSLPLWLGPVAELLAGRHPWIIDAVVAFSPLTHLAVASDNDLLRNQWFYQHSNLAALQYAYPRLAGCVAFYTAVGLACVLVPLAIRRPGRQAGGVSLAPPFREHVQ